MNYVKIHTGSVIPSIESNCMYSGFHSSVYQSCNQLPQYIVYGNRNMFRFWQMKLYIGGRIKRVGVVLIQFISCWNVLIRIFIIFKNNGVRLNHPGYVQFSAALLVVFALMFTAIAIDPLRNRNLIPYGILLKVSYAGIVFYYWATTGVPAMWKPFAIIDLAFMLGFVWSFMLIPSLREAEATG